MSWIYTIKSVDSQKTNTGMGSSSAQTWINAAHLFDVRVSDCISMDPTGVPVYEVTYREAR